MDRRDRIAETDLEWYRNNQAPFRLDSKFLTLEVPGKCSRSKRARSKLATSSLPSPTVSTKGLLVWGGLIAVLSIPLSAIQHISNWWLILAFGVILPIALGIGNRIANSRKIQVYSVDHSSERELLEVLERHGELTPLAAATKTSLTISEADQMLSELAQKGHLEVRIDGGKMSYALWERNRSEQ